MSDAPSAPHDADFDAFLLEVWSDHEAGRLKPLEEYQRLHPEGGERLEAEYLGILESLAACERDAGREPDPGELVALLPPTLQESLSRRLEALRDPETRNEARAAIESTIVLPRPFGEYTLLRVLGRGGMGVVFLAREESPRRHVALKLIRGGPLRDGVDRRRFEREGDAAGRLAHPAIVKVFRVGEVEGTPFIAMEWIPGGSLADRVRTAREGAGGDRRARLDAAGLRVERVAEIVAEIAEALQTAHDAGIVHRDVKPGNILLDDRGRPHLADFGLAKDLEASMMTESGLVAGTLAYMSPEQCEGLRRLDGRSDIWSLGVVLYEALTSERPFAGAEPKDIEARIRGGRFEAPRALDPAIPVPLEAICQACLEVRPEDRYGSAGALALDLRRFLAGERASVRRRGLRWKLRQHQRRYRAWYLGALLMATAGGATMAVVQSSMAERRERELRGRLESHAGDLDADPEVLGDRRREAVLIAEDSRYTASTRAAARLLAARIEERGAALEREARADMAATEASPPGTPIERFQFGTVPLYDLARIRLFQALRLQGKPVEDAETALRRDWARLDLDLPPGVVARIHAVDWLREATRRVAEREGPGVERLPPGPYLITILHPGGLFTEHFRWLEARGHLRLEPRQPPVDPLPGRLRTVPGGRRPVGQAGGGERFPQYARREEDVRVFLIQDREVTVGEYRRYLQERAELSTSLRPVSWVQSPDEESGDDLPVTGVTFHQALAYAEWHGLRLPTWFEMQAAAEHDGPEPSPEILRGPSPGHATVPWMRGLRPVGSCPEDSSRYGVFDLRANAREWTESHWIQTEAPALGEAQSYSLESDRRITVGFTWINSYGPNLDKMVPRVETPFHSQIQEPGVGFRCARSLRPRD